MNVEDWTPIHTHILHLEGEGLVTRTFRRLDPERQQAILLAILDEAAEKGPSAVSIKEVAQRAGVSVGSLYTYFPDRDRMLAFAVEVCVRFVTSSFRQYRDMLSALPLEQGLRYYLLGGIEWSRIYASFLRLFARAAYQGDPGLGDRLVRPVAGVLREMVHAILNQAVERGEIRADVDLEAATRIVHALMIAVGDSQLLPYLNDYYQVFDKDVPPDRMIDSLISFVYGGLGARSHD
jgi:AcrR family transcriptional regulator